MSIRLACSGLHRAGAPEQHGFHNAITKQPKRWSSYRISVSTLGLEGEPARPFIWQTRSLVNGFAIEAK
jgi:hypothetical protein